MNIQYNRKSTPFIFLFHAILMLLGLNVRNVCCTAHFIHIRGHEIKIRDDMLRFIVRI